MLKLKRYLKPYLGLLLVGVALLFGQAMLELTLPNYMSDIVNVGLQQGGIIQAAPEVIDSDAMAMMQMFMSEEDKALVDAAYRPLGEREDADKLKETYPNAGDEDLALAADPENGANDAFNRAAYALVNMMEELAPADSSTETEEQASGTLDAGAMAQLTAMLQSGALDEQLNEAIATAAVTPESMLEQTGVVLTKSFYTQLGADTDAIQTSYILKVGLRMAGLAILLTVCAISAGFCMARLGAGVGRDLRRDVFRKVSYFNNNEMDQFSGASLITRSTNDITQVQNFLSIGLRMMCFAPIMGIGGLIMGLSLGFVFQQGATTGGTDLIARLVKLKLPWAPMGKLLLVIDLAVILLVAVAFGDITAALYGIIAQVVSAYVTDLVLYGMDTSKVAYIISDKAKRISDAIVKDMDRGVTVLRGEGAYSCAEKEVLCAPLSRRRSSP